MRAFDTTLKKVLREGWLKKYQIRWKKKHEPVKHFPFPCPICEILIDGKNIFFMFRIPSAGAKFADLEILYLNCMQCTGTWHWAWLQSWQRHVIQLKIKFTLIKNPARENPARENPAWENPGKDVLYLKIDLTLIN